MVKQYEPDPAAALPTLLERLAKVEGRQAELGLLRSDVNKLASNWMAQDRTLANISASLNALATGQGASSGNSNKDDEPRPNWLTVRDPDAAVAFLRSITRWTTTTLPYLRGGREVLPLKPCWRWHPTAVFELLLIRVHYAEAAGSDGPTPIADYLGRWLPAALKSVKDDIAGCEFKPDAVIHKLRALTADGTRYTELGRAVVDVDEWPAYARWWATTDDRDALPPGLAPLPDRAPARNGYRS